jgi:hypothetical protein
MEWISVRTRLPKPGTYVLGCRRNGGRMVYWYDTNVPRGISGLGSESGFFDDGELDTAVTHWMPLPEPPQ